MLGREQRLIAHLQVTGVARGEPGDASACVTVLGAEREGSDRRRPLDLDAGVSHPAHVLVLKGPHRIVWQGDLLDQVLGRLVVIGDSQ